MAKKSIALFLTVVMALSLLAVPTMAVDLSDTNGHWAEKAIDRWSGEGVLTGYEDGSFRPDGSITRAELATVLYRVMNYITQAENTFSDVEQNAWYAKAVLSANAAGVLKGDGVGMRPEDRITRQEAIVMLGRALGVAEDAGAVSAYSDASAIADWAAGLVGGMTKAGFVQGSGGKINPEADITRAEAVTILNNAISALYSKAGTYSADAEKDVIVNVPGVILKDMTVKGDLIIAEGVGNGDVTLDSVKVLGKLIVRGGGENSIIIRGGSEMASVTISRVDGKVRVSVEGDASVEVIVVNDGSDNVKIEGSIGTVVVENSAAPVEITGTVKNVEIAEAATGAEVNVSESAKVETLTVSAPDAKVGVSGEVTNVNVAESAPAAAVDVSGKVGNIAVAATDTKVDVSGEVTKVEVADTAPGTNIGGSGKVDNVAANANDVKVTTPNTSVEAGEGTSGVTAGDKEVSGGTTETTPDKEPTPPPVVIPTVSIWDGTSVDDTWYDENSASFTLNSAAQLAGLAKLVNEGKTFAGKTVNLGINIDLNGHEWTPIGGGTSSTTPSEGTYGKVDVSLENAFSGVFDGSGRQISGLQINASNINAPQTGSAWVGFFLCSQGAAIRNVTFVSPNLAADYTDADVALNDKYAFAPVVGYAEDTEFTNVRVLGGTVTGSRPCGLAGAAVDCDFTNCSSSANLTASRSASGAMIVGGLAQQVGGYDKLEIEFKNCTYSGNISIDGANAAYVWAGGLYGGTTFSQKNNANVYYTLNVVDCAFTGTLTVTNANVGAYHGTARDTSGSKTNYFDGLLGRTHKDVEAFVLNGSAAYVSPGKANGSYSTYEPADSITTEAGLRAAIASDVENIKLGEDITLTGPISISKNVTIDGGNHTITGKANSGNRRQGLFHMFNEADKAVSFTLKNVKLINKKGVDGNNWSDASGVSVRASNQTVSLDNVTIDTSHYCVFVGVPGSSDEENLEDVNNVALYINKSTLTGYAAVYYRTNSTTNPITNPVLAVTNSSLIGSGIKGESNEFSTIVFNGTRGARASIIGCTLSNVFEETNVEANEGIISFNSWGAYEKDAVVTITNSTIKTNNNKYSPNVIKYNCLENLDVGNKVIIDNLTFTRGENDSELIRVMRGGNELVATGIDLKAIFEIKVHQDGSPGRYPDNYRMVVTSGDNVIVPVPITVDEAVTIPAGVTVTVNAAITGETISGESGAVLVIGAGGSYGGLAAGTYTWSGDSWTTQA